MSLRNPPWPGTTSAGVTLGVTSVRTMGDVRDARFRFGSPEVLCSLNYLARVSLPLPAEPA